MRLIDADELKKQLIDYFSYSMQLCAEISDFIDNAPTIEPDTDTISRKQAIEHLKKRLYETALNNSAEYPCYEEMADNRVDIWMREVPSAL